MTPQTHPNPLDSWEVQVDYKVGPEPIVIDGSVITPLIRGEITHLPQVPPTYREKYPLTDGVTTPGKPIYL